MAEWYYAQDEEQHGPVTAAALKEMAQAGKLDRDDLIWREGMQRWAPAHKVRGLFTEEAESTESRRRSEANGEAEESDESADKQMSDVVPVDDEDNDGDESGSVSGDGETAIDVLPLAGPEESKLHMPALSAPEQSPSSARSKSDEIVVFEPASSSPPPPVSKPPSRESEPPAHESATSRQMRIDVPPASRGSVLAGLGLFAQTFTWVSCLLVIIIGGVVYLGSLMMHTESSQRLSASGIYATFVLAAYFLARSTERICRAVGTWFDIKVDRTSRRSVRERNRQRFQ